MRITDQPSTGLTLCTDLAATDWLVDQDLPWYQLAGRGPIGFPKYARLRFIPDPSFPGQKSNDVDFDQTGPEEKVLIGFALDVLSSYTTTPDECYFCMWTGWGSQSVMTFRGSRSPIVTTGSFVERLPTTPIGAWKTQLVGRGVLPLIRPSSGRLIIPGA